MSRLRAVALQGNTWAERNWDPIRKPRISLFDQRTWRIAGGLSIAAAAFMAWYGSEHATRGHSIVFLVVYWGIFLLLLLFALYMVLIDVRYIRLQYELGRREIFRRTLGSEEFRRSLQETEAAQNPNPPPADED